MPQIVYAQLWAPDGRNGFPPPNGPFPIGLSQGTAFGRMEQPIVRLLPSRPPLDNRHDRRHKRHRARTAILERIDVEGAAAVAGQRRSREPQSRPGNRHSIVAPDPRHLEFYQGLYTDFQALYPATRDITHRLAGIQQSFTDRAQTA